MRSKTGSVAHKTITQIHLISIGPSDYLNADLNPDNNHCPLRSSIDSTSSALGIDVIAHLEGVPS